MTQVNNSACRVGCRVSCRESVPTRQGPTHWNQQHKYQLSGMSGSCRRRDHQGIRIQTPMEFKRLVARFRFA